MKIYEKVYATERPDDVVFGDFYVYVNSNIMEATEEEKLSNGFGEDITLYSFTKTEYERDEYIRAVPNNNRAKSIKFNGTGWHRIAKYFFETDVTVPKGSNGCDIIINCFDSSDFYYSETYDLKLLVGGDSSIISVSGCMGRVDPDGRRWLSEVRHTVNGSTGESYLEVYIPELGKIDYYVLINNGADQFHYWQPIDPIPVAETEDEFEVYSQVTLPLESKGTATYDENGNNIHETYLPKFNRKLTGADNFDTLTEPGAYFYMTESIPGNCPYENAGIVEVVRTGDDTTRILQRVTRYGQAGKSAFRTLFEGKWHDWTEVETKGCVCGTYTGNGKSNREIMTDCNGNIAFIYCPSGGDIGVVLVTPIGGIRFSPDSDGMTTGEPISISISYGYLMFWSNMFNTKGIEYEYQIMK